jgi:nucleotide-binding universal stress UspA family protein
MSRILIATDGSDCAIGAARTALGLLAPDPELTVLSVVDIRPEVGVTGGGLLGAEPLAMPLADPNTTTELDEALTAGANEAVERTIAALGVAAAQRMVVHGDPAAEICRVADETGYDLVVVGSHGSGFVKRVLVGSVSHHVLHHSSRPVLVLRCQQDGS